MTGKILAFIYLGICSLYDIRFRKIPVKWLRAGVLLSFLYVTVGTVRSGTGWPEILGRILSETLFGILPGAVLLVYSRLSGEKLGEADGWMAVTVGMLLGGKSCVLILMVSCFLTFFMALILLVTGKGNRKTQLPYAPFLLTGMAILWMTG